MIKTENPFIKELKDTSFFEANREYKSSLFTYLLTCDKRNALSVCNAIEGTNYTNPDDVSF